jgi:hypothetical protein
VAKDADLRRFFFRALEKEAKSKGALLLLPLPIAEAVTVA